MARKRKTGLSARAEGSANFEAVAKVSYQRKRTITEIVPPDVTRAKTGRWLDLISPITEWAGLRGDALRHQREQLRIRQEAALDRLAESVRELMLGRNVVHPLPPKIVVPALEAASREDPESPLISWWAKLLVSGATLAPLRPFLVDLMSKLGTEEAIFLERLWTAFSQEFAGTLKRRPAVLDEENRIQMIVFGTVTINFWNIRDCIEKIISDDLERLRIADGNERSRKAKKLNR